MATTTFGKNFKVEKKDVDQFIKSMNEPVKPLFDADFKSQFAHVEDYKKTFLEILKK